jgi:hypothetical protein
MASGPGLIRQSSKEHGLVPRPFWTYPLQPDADTSCEPMSSRHLVRQGSIVREVSDELLEVLTMAYLKRGSVEG